MKLELHPQSSDPVIADASRKAMRAYAREIEYDQPDKSKELFDYVRDLDKADRENKRRGININTTKNVAFTEQIILGVLAADSSSKDEMHHVMEKTGFAKYQRYLWTALKNLTGRGKIRLVKQNYELIQEDGES